MELKTVNGELKPGGAFQLIATGYFIGAVAIMVPLFALMVLIIAGISATRSMNGEAAEGGGVLIFGFAQIIMLPIILALQSLMFGGVVVFGLWLYRKRCPIRVIADDAGQ